MRAFLCLRQADVSAATGIPVARLSAAENGRLSLNPTEKRVLEEFLWARMRIVAGAEAVAQ